MPHLLGFAFAVLTVLALGGLAAWPPATGQVAAVFPPGTTFAEAAGRIGAAGGAVVRAGALDTVLIADPGPARGFRARLAENGPVLFLNPRILGSCRTIPAASAKRQGVPAP